MTETSPAVTATYPDQVVRYNFPHEDRMVVEGHWTEWDEPTRRAFADLVAGTRPSEVAAAIADFLGSNDPSRPAEQPEPALSPSSPAPVVVPDPEPVIPEPAEVASAPDVAQAAAPPIPVDELGPVSDPAPVGQTISDPAEGGQESGDAGQEDQAERVYAALRTGVTAKAWAIDHPEDVKAMIAYEEGDDGKGRKTVLHTLREIRDQAGVAEHREQ